MNRAISRRRHYRALEIFVITTELLHAAHTKANERHVQSLGNWFSSRRLERGNHSTFYEGRRARTDCFVARNKVASASHIHYWLHQYSLTPLQIRYEYRILGGLCHFRSDFASVRLILQAKGIPVDLLEDLYSNTRWPCTSWRTISVCCLLCVKYPIQRVNYPL